MNDPVFHAWLTAQHAAVRELADASDVLEVTPMPDGFDPPRHFLVRFTCPGLYVDSGGEIAVGHRWLVGIHLPGDYLRRVEAPAVVTWLEPLSAFHPQIRPPFVCLGHLQAGTELVAILEQLHAIITWRKATLVESDSLHPLACGWARNHPDRYPLEGPPLRRDEPRFTIELQPEVGP
jgi:hypothetical protein